MFVHLMLNRFHVRFSSFFVCLFFTVLSLLFWLKYTFNTFTCSILVFSVQNNLHSICFTYGDIVGHLRNGCARSPGLTYYIIYDIFWILIKLSTLFILLLLALKRTILKIFDSFKGKIAKKGHFFKIFSLQSIFLCP